MSQYGEGVYRDEFGRGIFRGPAEEVRVPSVVSDWPSDVEQAGKALPFASQRYTASQRGPGGESSGVPNVVQPYTRGRAGERYPTYEPIGSSISVVAGFGADSSGRQMSAQEKHFEGLEKQRRLQPQVRRSNPQTAQLPFSFPRIGILRSQVAARFHGRPLLGQLLQARR